MFVFVIVNFSPGLLFAAASRREIFISETLSFYLTNFFFQFRFSSIFMVGLYLTLLMYPQRVEARKVANEWRKLWMLTRLLHLPGHSPRCSWLELAQCRIFHFSPDRTNASYNPKDYSDGFQHPERNEYEKLESTQISGFIRPFDLFRFTNQISSYLIEMTKREISSWTDGWTKWWFTTVEIMIKQKNQKGEP